MLTLLSHPIIQTHIATLRDKNTNALTFRNTVKELTKNLLYEALKDTKSIDKSISTWRGEEDVTVLDLSSYVVVTVLRAGMPMLESVMETLPEIQAGFLAIKRDEITHESKLYYDRLADCKGKSVIIVDVMLATGGSLCDAIEIVKSKNAQKIISLNIIAAPEGIAAVEKKHPDVAIYLAQKDEMLNADKYIIPGLGDAGDRAYNTIES